MSDHAVSRVYRAQLPSVWSKLRPQIWRGMKRGCGDTLTEEYLFNGIADGSLDLWVIHREDDILAGLILRIDDRPRGKALVVLDAVGAEGHESFLAHTKEMLPRLREYADLIGAYTIESVSRPGAARLLSRLGCKPKAIIMELGNGRQHT